MCAHTAPYRRRRQDHLLLLNALMVLYCGDTSVAVFPTNFAYRGVATPEHMRLPRFGVWRRTWQSSVHQEVGGRLCIHVYHTHPYLYHTHLLESASHYCHTPVMHPGWWFGQYVNQVLDILTITGCGASSALRKSLVSSLRLKDSTRMASNHLQHISQVCSSW